MILLLAAAAGPTAGADGGTGRVQATIGGVQSTAASFSIAAADKVGAWHARTREGCRFGFELAPASSVFTTGTFFREKGGSCETFLSRLAAALEAKEIPKVKKADRVGFSATVLGSDLQQNPGGGCSGKGGGWTASKLFLGDEPAEVYLNFNPRTGEAEFSIKDADYGIDVLRVLATVL